MLFIYHLYLHTIYISFYFLHAAFYGSLSCTFISKAQCFTCSGTFFCIFIQWPIYLFYVWGKKPVLAEQTGLQRSMSPSSAAFSRAGRKQRCRCVPERMNFFHFTVCSQRELKWAGYLFCKTRGKYYVWKLLRRSKFKMSRFHNITARLNVKQHLPFSELKERVTNLPFQTNTTTGSYHFGLALIQNLLYFSWSCLWSRLRSRFVWKQKKSCRETSSLSWDWTSMKCKDNMMLICTFLYSVQMFGVCYKKEYMFTTNAVFLTIYSSKNTGKKYYVCKHFNINNKTLFLSSKFAY